ncbi:MAG TPA: hypothetical protein VNH44_10455 [Micropepsaceae bacterium]|nr:hypothetical protein [Micropepsaceae bacterium]
MTVSKLVLVAAAAGLCGCASTQASAPDQQASVKNAVYVVGQDNGTLKQTSADIEKPASPGESKMMHFYWFLGGR